MWHLGLTWGWAGGGGGGRAVVWDERPDLGQGYLSQSRPGNNCNIYTSTWSQGSLTSLLTLPGRRAQGQWPAV